MGIRNELEVRMLRPYSMSDPRQLAKSLIILIADGAGPFAQLWADRAAQQHLAIGKDQLDNLLFAEVHGPQPALHHFRQVLALDCQRTWHSLLQYSGVRSQYSEYRRYALVTADRSIAILIPERWLPTTQSAVGAET